ncbi:glycosyltransferase [Microbacterium sp. JZ37]|uniref:glycosyltransferase n=1 Tax=Microbacterium sp. JZ37 TaxID=2654193 RepID=UPI002B4854CB|nr:glycosyltransferase [Microbacterium sp. JZ37]
MHEWLERSGGAENVVEALRETFPDAELWSLWDASEGRFGEHVNETVLARTPLRGRKALALPFMPFAWRNLPEIEAEWMLVSSHLFAHHARFRGASAHIPKFVYTHTPARYIWVPELDGRGDGPMARALSGLLKPLDRKRAQEPVAIAANSQFIAERIADTWEREATVIYPPVAVAEFAAEPELTANEQDALDALPSEFLLGVSRFVPYKRLDAAIQAGKASGLPVVLAGRGPDEERLRAVAETVHPGKVSFVHHPSFQLLKALLRRAQALVFASIEDFGIVPVEAMASGTPVIANAVGGAAESVLEGVTGTHVREWNSHSEVRAAVERALGTDSRACTARARDFDYQHFEDGIAAFVKDGLRAAARP